MTLSSHGAPDCISNFFSTVQSSQSDQWILYRRISSASRAVVFFTDNMNIFQNPQVKI